MNPEIYQAVMNKLLECGALDVTITQVLMKKGRPGCILQVLAKPALEKKLGQVVLEETSAIGYRVYSVRRQILERTIINVNTYYGQVSVKVATDGNKLLNVAPEYDDCYTVARNNNVPVKEVYNLAIKEAYSAIKEDFVRKNRSL